MCGLLAASGKINPHYLMALGCFNAKRGVDSAGIAWVGNDGKVEGQKIAAHPIPAFSMHFSDGLKKGADSGIFIGHTRAATQGEVNEENAHPFLMDGIAFAHNGIIYNDEEFGTYKVDSQALIHGIKEKNFSKYRGSIALVWMEEGKLHAYRHGNPLYRGLADGALYLASEESFLKDIGCKNTRELADSHLYIISGGGIIKSSKIPENSLNSTTTYYRSENHDDYFTGFQSNPVSKDPRPAKRMRCGTCNHRGKAHNKMDISGGWGCWAKNTKGYGKGYTSSGICPCHRFVAKIKESEVEVSNKGLIANPQQAPFSLRCSCDHSIRAHFMRGISLVCNAPGCPCMMFDRAEAAAPKDDNEWGDVDAKVVCDCRHELEYHQTAGAQPCAVASCQCNGFWPAEHEDILPPDGMAIVG